LSIGLSTPFDTSKQTLRVGNGVNITHCRKKRAMFVRFINLLVIP
jgi:hypothetical protein